MLNFSKFRNKIIGSSSENSSRSKKLSINGRTEDCNLGAMAVQSKGSSLLFALFGIFSIRESRNDMFQQKYFRSKFVWWPRKKLGELKKRIMKCYWKITLLPVSLIFLKTYFLSTFQGNWQVIPRFQKNI